MKKNILIVLFIPIFSVCPAQTKKASNYIEKANDFLEEKNYQEAFNTLNYAINIMPDSIKLYDMRGTLLEAFKYYDEAIKDFTTGIEKTKNLKYKSHLLANRGGTKNRIRDFVGSYNDLIRAIEIDSTNLAALNNLAAVCDDVGKPELTLKYLHQIIRINPDYAPAYVNLGFKYQEMNQHEKAIKNFNRSIELAPDEALGFSNRSYSKLKVDDLDGAMDDINHSIKLFPINSYAFKIKALIFIKKNNLKDACINLDKAIELGYSNQYGDEVNNLKANHCKKN